MRGKGLDSTLERSSHWILPSFTLPTAGALIIWQANQPPSSRQHTGAKMNYVDSYAGVGTLARQRIGTEPNDGQNHMATPTFSWAGIVVKPNVPLAFSRKGSRVSLT